MYTLISLILLLLSAWFDAKGFYYAGLTWTHTNQLSVKQGALSLLFFMIGVSLYVFSVRFLTMTGATSTTIQTLLWFVATIVGVAIMNGDFKVWGTMQYAAFSVVILGLAALISLSAH
ncbi:hypothetical protein GV054_19175 [Marinomonas mediterranea]|uniref:hypothetical protein n=1 Tax=Marinomonas mediterranea TaxID=119864 RepID=UPI00234BC482|nr:hypothetical protein [Marinomonas mediterranea]WCN14977.1 hypothetical protein GV054_19175 [Marinomonas mediterranea]